MYDQYVTVIIPAYNAESTIERAVLSVIYQEWILELIIVDDCSADTTKAKITNLQKKFDLIQLVELPKNMGASAARNAGINISKGKYIAFLDADDVWLPGKLAAQVILLEENPEVTLVSCDALQLSSDGQILKRAHQNRPPVNGINAWKTLLAYNFLPTPTIMARKDHIVAAGGFSETLKVGEDLDLWIKLATIGKISVLSDVYVHYYDYPGSLMKSEGKGSEGIILEMIKNHIQHNSEKLDNDEVRKILGTRLYDFGLNFFFSDRRLESIYFFLGAMKKGVQVMKSFQLILRALFLHQ